MSGSFCCVILSGCGVDSGGGGGGGWKESSLFIYPTVDYAWYWRGWSLMIYGVWDEKGNLPLEYRWLCSGSKMSRG